MEKLFFLTSNQGKLTEAREILGDCLSVVSVDIDLPEVQSTNPQEVIDAKLNEARKHVEGPLLVEDTSLFFLNWGKGELPGPLIKHFLRNCGTEGLCALAANFGRAARALTVAGLSLPGSDKSEFFSGELIGTISESPRGENGFGWDQIFEVQGKTLAEYTPAEKNVISMRRAALVKLKRQLNL